MPKRCRSRLSRPPAAALPFALLLALVSTACAHRETRPPVWVGSALNESGTVYLVMLEGHESGTALPGHSGIDVASADSGRDVRIAIFSPDCQPIAALTLSEQRPVARVDAAGSPSLLTSEEALAAGSAQPYGQEVFGFTCAEDGWEVLVRNDSSSEWYLHAKAGGDSTWRRVLPGGRALLLASDYGPFPSDATLEVFRGDCTRTASVVPTRGAAVANLDASGAVSLQPTSFFWEGITEESLARGSNSFSGCRPTGG